MTDTDIFLGRLWKDFETGLKKSLNVQGFAGCCGKLGKDAETRSLLEPFNIVSKNLWFRPAGVEETAVINKRPVAPRQNLFGSVS